MNNPPVIFLAYASCPSDSDYLVNIPLETDETRTALDRANRNGLIELVIRENVTLEGIIKVFLDESYKGRIAIFHFSGHANGFSLVLENPFRQKDLLYSKDFSTFLASQSSLQVVFLNACSTLAQSQSLIEKGIPSVIATRQEVSDVIARKLAVYFYIALGAGSKLEQAFQESISLIKSQESFQDYRALFRKGELPTDTRPPWSIDYHTEKEYIASWSLTDAADRPLYSLPQLPEEAIYSEPFPGLQPYSASQHPIFWGRDYEIRDLYNLITDHESPNVILVYGGAGVGKTSFIQAGVLPYLALKYKVNVHPYSEQLSSSLEEINLQQKAVSQAEKAILIIDDLTDASELSFLTHIQKIASDHPDIRIILCLRTAVLSELEIALRDKVKYKTFYLPSLGYENIKRIVLGGTEKLLAKEFNAKVEEELAKRLAIQFSEDQTSCITPVLQYTLLELWQEAKSQNLQFPLLDWELFLRLQNTHLWERFLEQQLTKTINQIFHKDFILNILQEHLQVEYLHNGISLTQLQEKYPTFKDSLASLIKELTKHRLICDPTNSALATSRFSHKVLVIPLLQLINQSQDPGQLIPRILNHHLQQKTNLNQNQLELILKNQAIVPSFSKDEEKLIQESTLIITEQQKQLRRNRIFRMILIVGIISLGYLFSNPFFLLYLLLLFLAYKGNRIVG